MAARGGNIDILRYLISLDKIDINSTTIFFFIFMQFISFIYHVYLL